MDDRMYLVNRRTGHVARLASFRHSSGWSCDAFAETGQGIQEAFLLAQAGGEYHPEEWYLATEGDPLVLKYQSERHPLGLRH